MSSSRTEAGLVDVTMPQMGVSVAEGTIVGWRKQVGDWVQADETICEVSTDKIDTEVPAPASGRVAEVLVDEGTTVDVGTVLARVQTDARPGEAHASESDLDTPPAVGAPATSEAAAANGDTPAPSSDDPAPVVAEPDGAEESAAVPARGAVRYSPVVQRIAAEHGVDLAQVTGTGRGGRVRKQDVLAFVESGPTGGAPAAEPVEEPPLHIESPYRPEPAPTLAPAAAPAASAPPPRAPAPPADGAYRPPAPQPLSRMRQSIGEHMKRSLDTAATCTTWMEADMGRIEQARRELGVTALPLVARCAIDALREHPSLNAWLDANGHVVHEEVNLGIAVSLGEDGLIVPVIRSAQELSAEGLARRIRDLAKRARARQLTPDDVRDATFTITNPGQYGSIMATPVINQPQVAILDLEAVVKRPVVVENEDGSDAIAIRPMTILGLSWDHRALDGALAAQFLGTLRRRIEGWAGG